jgi:hypothetical protein
MYEPVIICNLKQGHYSHRRICEMMTLNEIYYNPAISTFLSVVGLAVKISQTHNMLLLIKLNGKYIHVHHKQMKVVYHHIYKES